MDQNATLTNEQRQQLFIEELFAESNGEFTFNQAHVLCEKLEIKRTAEEIQAADKNNNGKLNLTEFNELIKSKARALS